MQVHPANSMRLSNQKRAGVCVICVLSAQRMKHLFHIHTFRCSLEESFLTCVVSFVIHLCQITGTRINAVWRKDEKIVGVAGGT